MGPVLRPLIVVFGPILRPLINVLADQRVRQVLGQLVFTLAVILFFWWMGSTAATELADKGLVPTFNFLDLRAGFAISESPEWYTSDSTYGQAFVTGITNTLRIVVFGLVLSSVVGLFVGVFLLSSNWLIRSIAPRLRGGAAQHTAAGANIRLVLHRDVQPAKDPAGDHHP